MTTTIREARRSAGQRRRFSLDIGPRQMSPAERAERGRALRGRVPRGSHADFEPAADRDPLELLRRQSATRVPDLVPIRYGRMLASPFAYFRGAALPMAADLAGTPITGLALQACGDAHVGNFGFFGSAERRLVFDINDFDETLPGPWEWDVKRMAASLEIAGRDNGFSRRQRAAIVLAGIRRYRLAMAEFARMSNLEVWYARADVETIRQRLADRLSARQRQSLARGVARAQTRDSTQALSQLTRIVDGRPRIVADPPLIVPLSSLLPGDVDRTGVETELTRIFEQYKRTLAGDRRYLLEQYSWEASDIARKVVGVGSVGTRCWILLMLGRDGADPLFLQIKEAVPSVLSEFAGRTRYDNQGQRVVEGQRLMQAASDIFLGWQRMSAGLDGKPHDFYVRQLRDWKFSLDTQAMIPSGMADYGEVCGWTLARAHARSGDRIAISAYLGTSDTFDRAIGEFASAYADRNERDIAALDEAAKSGRVLAQRGQLSPLVAGRRPGPRRPVPARLPADPDPGPPLGQDLRVAVHRRPRPLGVEPVPQQQVEIEGRCHDRAGRFRRGPAAHDHPAPADLGEPGVAGVGGTQLQPPARLGLRLRLAPGREPEQQLVDAIRGEVRIEPGHRAIGEFDVGPVHRRLVRLPPGPERQRRRCRQEGPAGDPGIG